MEHESTKIPVKAVIIIVASLALIWLTHPLWCNHSFETIGEDAAACTESGVEYRRCKRCGLKRERRLEPIAHSMKQSDVEIEEVDGSVYGKAIRVCENCGYEEAGEPRYLGTAQEYAAKMGVSIWLITEGKLGSVLDIDSAIVTHIADGDYYRVIGESYNILSNDGSLIESHVILDKNNDVTVIFAAIDGEVVVDKCGT